MIKINNKQQPENEIVGLAAKVSDLLLKVHIIELKMISARKNQKVIEKNKT